MEEQKPPIETGRATDADLDRPRPFEATFFFMKKIRDLYYWTFGIVWLGGTALALLYSLANYFWIGFSISVVNSLVVGWVAIILVSIAVTIASCFILSFALFESLLWNGKGCLC